MNSQTTELICRQVLQSPRLFKGAAVLGLSIAAFSAASTWARRSRVETLCDAVDALNDEIAEAIDMGLDLAGLRGIEFVLAELVSSGSEIGRSMSFEMQGDQQAATDEPRAVWEPSTQRIELRVEGEAGARGINFWDLCNCGAAA